MFFTGPTLNYFLHVQFFYSLIFFLLFFFYVVGVVCFLGLSLFVFCSCFFVGMGAFKKLSIEFIFVTYCFIKKNRKYEIIIAKAKIGFQLITTFTFLVILDDLLNVYPTFIPE